MNDTDPEKSDTPKAAAELDLDAIMARAKAATSGPWEVIQDEVVDSAWVNAAAGTDDKPIALFDYRPGNDNKANAAFVAHAREDVPALIEMVIGLRRRVADLLDANNREIECRVEANAKLQDALAHLQRLGVKT